MKPVPPFELKLNRRQLPCAILQLGSALLAVIGILSRTTPITPGQVGAPQTVALVVSGALLSLVLLTVFQPRFLLGLAVSWTIAGALEIPLKPNLAITPIPWVGSLEALVIAVSFLCLARPTRWGIWTLMISVIGMLTLFGIIHIAHASSVASLIPAWFPERTAVPFATGGLMLLSACLFTMKKLRAGIASAMAAMFATWLPIVHLPRIIATPGDAGEWNFAAMAVCLVGSLLTTRYINAGDKRGRRVDYGSTD